MFLRIFVSFPFCVFLITFSLQATPTSFAKGQWSWELQGGSLQNKVSDDASPERFSTLFFLYDVGPLVQSPNPERRNLGLAKAASYQESEIRNQNVRFGLEYALLSWLGFGGSITRSNTQVTNVLPGDYLILASFGVPVPSPRGDAPELTNFGTFFPRTLNANLTVAELEIALHYPIALFDVYLRGGMGQLWEGGSGRKESLAIGTKLVWENWFVTFELYRGSLFSDLGRTDFFREEGFRLGTGFRFLPKDANQ